MTAVLRDTGCIVALLDRREEQHARCVQALRTLSSGSLVTCEAVIAESCYLLRGQPGAADAILANVGARHISRPISAQGTGPMDLADACLVTLAESLGTGRILTLDSDFRIYRWPQESLEHLLD